MKIYFFCPRWGSEHVPFEQFLDKVKDAGYEGVEMSLPTEAEKKEKVREAFSKRGLQFLAQHHETATPDFPVHRKEYEQRLRNLASAGPIFINSQTGRDFFSFEQNCELIETASRVENETGVKIYHETHRGKFSFAPHITRSFVESLPGLRLSVDLSHWCAVTETLLDEQEETVNIILARAEHIHARIGFAEGPQIPDPRVPEWQETVERHLGWWDRIIERAEGESRKSFTITPEFGPVPYMQIQPFTRMPISNQWDINVYMMEMLRDRYTGHPG